MHYHVFTYVSYVMNNGYGVRYYCAGCVDVYWHTFFFIHSTHNYYLYSTHIVTIWFKNVDFNKSKWWGRFGFGNEKQELQIKQAAAYKLNTLVTNARDIHRRVPTNKVFVTYFGRGLSTYALHGTRYIKTGGLFWFWRRVYNQTIFYEEGIFYSARLIASNLSQCFISILIVVFGSKFL